MERFKDIDIQSIYDAKKRISGIIQKTPLIQSHGLSENLNKDVRLKLENLQPTGAFKLRGAANAILNLSETQKKRGVVTMSTGNHGRGIAYVAKHLGIKAVICVSEMVPAVKVNAIKALGATVKTIGRNQEEAAFHALELQKNDGLHYISAFDDPDVIAGQGTITLEILEQNPDTDTLLVPVSGGGLMSGMAFTAKQLKPDIKMIGVSNDVEPAIYTSLKAGYIVEVRETESVADALPGPIPLDNEYTFEMCKIYSDNILLVSEDQIKQGMAYALIKEKLVLEGGGAAPIACLLEANPEQFGHHIVALCSGCNINMRVLIDIARKYAQYFD